MSKRKLTWFVENGYVDGWEDPRFPTVRGVLRRGLTIEALKQFIVAQGSSRSVVFMEWDKIWAMNKKVIDPVAPRYTTVDKTYHVTVHVGGVKESSTLADLHPKNPDVGQKTIWQSSQILIDGADAEALVEGTNATFINWGNMMVKKIVREGDKVVSIDAEPNLENKDFKKTLKVTWLAQTDKAMTIPTIQVYYDHIIKKAVLDKDDDFKQFIGEDTKFELEFLGDPEFVKLKKGDIIQVQRRGFFIVDQPYSPPSANSCKPVPIRLIAIPDGTPTSYGPPGKSVAKPPATQSSGKGKNTGGGNKKSSPKVAPSVSNGGDGPAIHDKIVAQGEKVRVLKANKCAKAEIDQAVKALLDLKAQYKAATGSDWKPGILVNNKAQAASKATGDNQGDELNEKVIQQGDLVRKLKSEKATKADIDQAVKSLLAAKEEYKKATGKDWKPGAHVSEASASPPSNSDHGDLNAKVTAQGEVVRKLKGEKADKAQIDAAVKALLDLKAQYKAATGSDWKPGILTSTKATPASSSPKTDDVGSDLNDQIAKQGDLVRQLKADKADKAQVTAAVQTLLDLKAKFKTATGQDWKPGNNTNPPARDNKKASSPSKTTTFELSDLEKDLQENIAKQGDVVRKLKADKADKADVDANIKILLDLKAKFKEKLGRDWAPPANGGAKAASAGGGRGGGARKPKEKKANKPQAVAKKEDNPTGQKVTRLGMEAKKEESLSDWYSQIIVKGELLEYYDVSGCYILRPWAFSIWEKIVAFFDEEIKKLGVENCYFPMFVSQTALQKEKDHIADFSPEVAWVTRSGDSELAEPIAIRPTSETIMYPAFAKWIQSHRDLPLRINQWSNVVVRFY